MKTLLFLFIFVFSSVSFASNKDCDISKNSIEYHGNIKSHIYHAPSCKYYNCRNCVAVFKSEQEAKDAGYRECRIE